MFSMISALGARYPRMRTRLGPLWRAMLGLIWSFRSKVLGCWPVLFSAGPHTISMIAKGQIAEVMWRGSFEQYERDFTVREVRPGMCVFNIGANAGLYTLIASKLVGPKGRVYAFEPSSHTFGILTTNIAENGCKNVIANHLAISNFNGKLSLNRDPSYPEYDGHFFVRRLSDTVDDSSRVEVVSCQTLDDYWSEVSGVTIKPVDFLIVDVEGAELGVLEGALKTLEASPNLTMIIECTENLSKLRIILESFGFNIYKYDLDSKSLIPTPLERGSLFAFRGRLA